MSPLCCGGLLPVIALPHRARPPGWSWASCGDNERWLFALMSRVDHRSWPESPRTQPAICVPDFWRRRTAPIQRQPGCDPAAQIAWSRPTRGGRFAPPPLRGWQRAPMGVCKMAQCALCPGPGGGGQTACAFRPGTAPCPAPGDGGRPPRGPSINQPGGLTCPPVPRATPAGARGRISVSALGLGLAGQHFLQPPSEQPDAHRVSVFSVPGALSPLWGLQQH